MQDQRSDCRGHIYCNHWRTCERCARRRSAMLADRAEFLEKRQGKLALAVFKPQQNTQEAIKRLRDKLIRDKIAPAGIWTIETGALYLGLHINIIHPSHAIENIRKRAEYCELINTSARAAAAYISKRSGMPTIQQYSGRLQGEWGKVNDFLINTNDRNATAAKAAAVNAVLSGRRSIADYYKTDLQICMQAIESRKEKMEKTQEEYAEIARRNLSALYQAVNLSGRQEPRYDQRPRLKP